MKTAEDIMQDHVDPHCFIKPQCYDAVISAMQEYAKQIADKAYDAGQTAGTYEFIQKNKLQERFLWVGATPPTKEDSLKSILNNL